MPTPIFICGAECGLAAAGTAGVGVEHWSFATGSVTSAAAVGGHSGKALRFNPTAASAWIRHTYAAAVGSPATVVGRCYLYFTTLPSANTVLIDSGANFHGQIRFNQSDSTLRTQAGGTLAGSGAAVTTGVLYRLDFKVVHGATLTVDAKLDGVDLAQASEVQSAGAANQIDFGPQSSVTTDLYIDDIIMSGTSGDYPIGAGLVAGLYPNGDGTHVYNAAADFGKAGTALTALNATPALETTSWQSLKNPLSLTVDTTKFISDQAGASTEYLEWAFDDLPAVTSVNGLMVVTTNHAASATGNNITGRLNDNGTTDNVYAAADFSETTIVTAVKTYATAPSTSSAWTKTRVDALKFQWGLSTDVNPDPILDGVMFEVDYVPVAPGDSLALSPATITVTTVAPARTVGGASRAVTPATISVTESALGRSAGGVSRAMAPATVTVTPAAPARTAANALALSPATISVTESALGRSLGGVSRSLAPATITIVGSALARTTAISRALSPAAVTVTAQALARTLGGASRALAPASVTVTAAALARAAGAASRALSPASISTTPVALGRTAGGVSRAAAPATITVTPGAQGITQGQNIALSPATVTVTGVTLARTVGAATRALSPAAITVTPVALARTGAVTRSLSPSSITITPQTLTLSAAGGGADTLALSPATIVVTPIAPARTVGGVSRSLAPSSITVTPQALGRSAAVARALGVTTITITPLAFGRTTGGTTRALGVATITVTPQLLARTGAVSVGLDPSTITITVQMLVLVRVVGAGSPPFISSAFAVRGHRSAIASQGDSTRLAVVARRSEGFAVREHGSDLEVY